MGLRYATRFDGISGSAIRDIFKLLTNPEIISFAGGNPANSALQSDVVSRLAQKVLAENGVFICSGIIDDRAEEVKGKLEEAGFAILESRSSEGWFSFTCRPAERG